MLDVKLTIHVGLILTCYTLYGVLQEKIMKGNYDGIQFTSSFTLVLFNRLFSIVTAVLCLFLNSLRKSSESVSFRERISPKQSIKAYAAVACFNTAATMCQYNSLKFVSFATTSLGKCFKMVPVLLIGSIIYGKTHKSKQWIAAGVIVLGCGTYLFSNTFVNKQTSPSSIYEGSIGALLLIGYLFFDGLTSTTQEKLFSGSKSSNKDPFSSQNTVFEQMIFVSLFSACISVVGALITNQDGGNLELLLTCSELWKDIIIFCTVSAVGLIALLSTISTYGALFSSTIMTIRQFSSIVVNYSIFSSSAHISSLGWTGILWVAAGIFIKMDSRFKEPKKIHFQEDSNSELMSGKSSDEHGGDKDTYLPISTSDELASVTESLKKNRSSQLFQQYGIPLLVPIVVTLLLRPFLDTSLPTIPIETLSVSNSTPAIAQGAWGTQILSLVSSKPGSNETTFKCNHSSVPTTISPSRIRTAFASYPRSGNSMTRTYLERTSGYSTSSVYADRGLLAAFTGEADNIAENSFFVKTHFPALDHEMDISRDPNYYAYFDQVYHLIRNPFDAINSLWHLQHSVKGNNAYDHNGRIANIPPFGPNFDEGRILFLAERWRDHTIYWENAPIATLTVRYEDFVKSKVLQTMELLQFVMEESVLPALEKVACLLDSQTDTSHQAYKSARESSPDPFDSYNLFTPETRMKILKIVARPYCKLGYNRLLASVRKDLTQEEKDICVSVNWLE